MRNYWISSLVLCGFLSSAVVADEMSFPEIEGATIEGAPNLQAPFLVMGGESPVKSEKHGLAAPALFDWDGDGKRDLLVGEFETNSGELFPMGKDGSTVRVYKNVGTDNAPVFSDEFEWARDTEGTIMEVEQWCCIGFTPYFYDLNDDGFLDMITGQYHPGEVTWFRGSTEGFLPGIKLPQEGDPSADWSPMMPGDEGPDDEIETFTYWVYSSAAMGDFDDDGDYDLVFGGSGGLRMSENIGTPKDPKFGRRQLLLDEDGNPLVVRTLSPEEIEAFNQIGGEFSPDGDGKTSPYVVDWDRDGVLDLLVTGAYTKPGDPAVMFFKGVKTDSGHRFQTGVDLLRTADGSKALPGSGPRVYVDDWNGDGVPDLIVGASIATVNDGEFSDELSWEWESVNKVESAGKDPGLYPPRERPTEESMRELFGGNWSGTDEELKEMVQMNIDYWEESVGRLYKEGKGHWLTMRHQGRIYVMLGTEPPSGSDDSASLGTQNINSIALETSNVSKFTPVSLELNLPKEMETEEQAEVSVTFTIAEGWYIYAPTGRNSEQGMAETEVSFTVPGEIERVGDVKQPMIQFKGMFDIFNGPSVNFGQRFATDKTEPGTYEFAAEVTFQTCKDDLCLPKQTETLKGELVVLAAQ